MLFGDKQKLLAAMGGSSVGWTYRGKVDEQGGQCACGNIGCNILFILENPLTGAEIKVGSSCVSSFKGLIDEGALKALKAEARRGPLQRIRLVLTRVGEFPSGLAKYTAQVFKDGELVSEVPANGHGPIVGHFGRLAVIKAITGKKPRYQVTLECPCGECKPGDMKMKST